MASLRRVPRSPYWIACFTLPDGRRTQRSTGTKDRRKAMRVANSYEDASLEAQNGRFIEARARKTIADIYNLANQDSLPSSSTRDFLTNWLKRKELEAGETTHARYETVVAQLLDYLGAKARRDVAHLSSKEIAGFRDHLAKRVTPGTVNFAIKVIRVALNQGRRDGLVDVNEAERVTLLKKKRTGDRRPFTMDELRSILKVAKDEWRGMILVGLYTGLRLGDVATLTWNNVDLERGELRLTTAKTGRRQILPLAKPLLNHLLTLPAGDDPDAPIFPSAHSAKQRSQYGGTLSNQFYQILFRAGLAPKRTHESKKKGRDARRKVGGLSFHCLRHTATSLLKNAGVSDVVARDIIGHESAAVSANYTHIDMETKRKALGALPDVSKG